VKESSSQSSVPNDESGNTCKLSAESAELLRLIQGRLETFSSASTIWRDYLTDVERAALGGMLENAWHEHGGTLGFVSHARNCSKTEALLWLCQETNSLPATRIDSIRRELGIPAEPEPLPPRSDPPRWNKERGELSLDGKVIRKFRSITVAHRVVAILDAFEECGWCERIDNPLPSGDPHQMREAIYSLNNDLELIRFNADGTATGVRWERS
jgi:hypothetical protein